MLPRWPLGLPLGLVTIFKGLTVSFGSREGKPCSSLPRLIPIQAGETLNSLFRGVCISAVGE